MPEEIIHCGHRFVLRPDGLYESVDHFEISDLAWASQTDAAGCSMAFRRTGPDSTVAWLLCTDDRYYDVLCAEADNNENSHILVAPEVPDVDKEGRFYIGSVFV